MKHTLPVRPTKLLQLFLGFSSCLLLTQCGKLKVYEKESAFVPLMKLEPEQQNERYHDTYKRLVRQVDVAEQWETKKPAYATAIYLQVAKYVWDSQNPYFIPIYNQAVGQALDLMLEHRWTSPTEYQTEFQSFHVSFDTSQTPLKDVDHMDDLIPVDCTYRRGLRSEVSQDGIGAPMVATHGRFQEKQNPFVNTLGGSFNLSALIDFKDDGEAVVHFYDASRHDHVEVWGKRHPLKVNLTASTYIALETKTATADASRIMGVFRPMRYSGRMGLHLEAPFDPNKTPLILVHGLVSSPDTWADPVNELMADPEIRHQFQPYMFYYPTGFPVRMTGAKLKEDLRTLHKYTREHSAPGRSENMVIIGHSMGGLLTSMMVRDLDESAWSKLSHTPIEELKASPYIKADLVTLFNTPQPSELTRAIFIATPHRGSNKANTWYGSFVATLIRIPKEIVRFNITGAAQSMTDLGKSMFNRESPVNSMSTLKEGNPALRFIADRPIPDSIPYHSIMGDRGKGGGVNSSDGIVPYSSSHLDGAESELIVPSGHGAHRDPAAVKEMNRILRKHLNLHQTP